MEEEEEKELFYLTWNGKYVRNTVVVWEDKCDDAVQFYMNNETLYISRRAPNKTAHAIFYDCEIIETNGTKFIKKTFSSYYLCGTNKKMYFTNRADAVRRVVVEFVNSSLKPLLK
jgi:hypothetical protein